MKPKNFPARKLRRQLTAQYRALSRTGTRAQIAADMPARLEQARTVRTKKYRGN